MIASDRACKGLIFDLDGTLIDSAPDIAASINDYFVIRGWPEVEAELVAQFTGKGTDRLVHDLLRELRLPHDSKTVREAVAGYLAAYRRAPARYTHLYDGVREDLDLLARHGFQMGVCTNKLHDLSVRILDLLGVGSLFAAVAGADNVPACKPDPSHLFAVAERMGLAPGSWVYVGDTTIDQQAALAAGVPFYAVPWGTGRHLRVNDENRLTRLADLVALFPADSAPGALQ